MLNTPGEGGEAWLRCFCLDYLPRTAGPSSSTCLCNVAPMGAAVLGTAVCSGSRCRPGESALPTDPREHGGEEEKNPCCCYSTNFIC